MIENRKQARLARRRSEESAGFTLIELMLALTLTVMVMVGVLTIFQTSARLARNQTQLADLQQNLRVALYDTQRYARMAGRGGLPTSLAPNNPYLGKMLPNGAAIEIDNNVPTNTKIDGTVAAGPAVVPGTDILTVRGVLFGSVYQSEVSVPKFSANTITVGRLSAMGVEQDLEVLADAVERAEGGDPEALIVVSPLGSSLYGIVELTGGSVSEETISGQDEIKSVTLNFITTGGTRQTTYLQLMPSGVFPPQMTSAAYVGVLEEYRYYVRDTSGLTAPSDDPLAPPSPPGANRGLVPRLSRARFYPGTDVPHKTNPSLAEDVADNVLDLQIALGVDANGDGIVADAADNTDEWLFNDPDDVLDSGAPSTWVWNGSPLELMRITALVRTDQRDLKYVSEAIDVIEDHLYSEPDTPADSAQLQDRRYRRRQVQSIVDFRNL